MVVDADVDRAVVTVRLPAEAIRTLGLDRVGRRRETIDGRERVDVYGSVRLAILHRSMPMDVFELPDGRPALVGHVVLTGLDLVIDAASLRLSGNPTHGDWILEML